MWWWLTAAGIQVAAESPAALSDRAREMAARRQYADAEKLWRRAIAADPRFYPALFNLGYMQVTRNRPDLAEPWLAQACALQAREYQCLYLHGLVLSKLGRREDGLRRWQQALALRPQDAGLLMTMAVEYGEGRYFGEAAAAARRALQLRPDDKRTHFIAIKALHDNGDRRLALQTAQRTLARFPGSARAHFEYPFALQRQGRHAESNEHLERALEMQPGYEEPHFFLGEALVSIGRTEEAVPHFRQAADLRPDYVQALASLGRALTSLGRLEEAERELRRLAGIAPDRPDAHVLLAQVYFRLGKEDLAARER